MIRLRHDCRVQGDSVVYLFMGGYLMMPAAFAIDRISSPGLNFQALATQRVKAGDEYEESREGLTAFEIDVDNEDRMILAVNQTAKVTLTIRITQALSVTVSFGREGLQVMSHGERRGFMADTPSDLPTLHHFAARAFGAEAGRQPRDRKSVV